MGYGIGATGALAAACWGAGAVLFVGKVGYFKLWFWLGMESNRALREVRRLELQIARANAC